MMRKLPQVAPLFLLFALIGSLRIAWAMDGKAKAHLLLPARLIKRESASLPLFLDRTDDWKDASRSPSRRTSTLQDCPAKNGLLITALLEAGLPLYPVNPKTIDRKRAPSGAKTDLIDAYLLAKHGCAEFADLHRLDLESPTIAELKALTRDQDALVQVQTRLVNQLTACLKAYYPVALTLFTKLQQKSTLLFLQAYPTLEAAQAAS